MQGWSEGIKKNKEYVSIKEKLELQVTGAYIPAYPFVRSLGGSHLFIPSSVDGRVVYFSRFSRFSAKPRAWREGKAAMSTMSLFRLCLNISSKRWKRERDELLPLLLESKKQRRFPAEEEMEKMAREEKAAKEEEEKKKKKKEEEVAKKARKEKAAKKGGEGGGFLQVAPPPPQRLFLDLNEEPNPLWEEMKSAGKPTVVFNRMLTDSDVRRNLARCILNRHEMLEVFVPALTKEEAEQVYDKNKKLRVAVVAEAEGRCETKVYEMNVVWWKSLKQFALVNGWTEFVHDNRLLKNDLIQLSYFRFGDNHDEQSQQPQQQLRLGLLIHCRPEFLKPDPEQEQEQEQEQDEENDER